MLWIQALTHITRKKKKGKGRGYFKRIVGRPASCSCWSNDHFFTPWKLARPYKNERILEEKIENREREMINQFNSTLF